MKDTLKAFGLGLVFWTMILAGMLIGMDRQIQAEQSVCTTDSDCLEYAIKNDYPMEDWP